MPDGLGVTLMVEQSITVGNIIEITVIAAGGVSVFTTMRNTVKYINSKIDDIQLEIKKLSDVLIEQARFDVKLTNLEQRVTGHDRRIEELAHGDGYVHSRPTAPGASHA